MQIRWQFPFSRFFKRNCVFIAQEHCRHQFCFKHLKSWRIKKGAGAHSQRWKTLSNEQIEKLDGMKAICWCVEWVTYSVSMEWNTRLERQRNIYFCDINHHQIPNQWCLQLNKVKNANMKTQNRQHHFFWKLTTMAQLIIVQCIFEMVRAQKRYVIYNLLEANTPERACSKKLRLAVTIAENRFSSNVIRSKVRARRFSFAYGLVGRFFWSDSCTCTHMFEKVFRWFDVEP